jgi:hypothetical protein
MSATTSEHPAGAHYGVGPWAAVLAMIAGFLICMLGFIFGNTVWLWIPGGVVGGVGVVLAFACNLMGQTH